MRSRLILTLVLASFGVSIGAYYDLRHKPAPVKFETSEVTLGSIVANVVCTGALQPVETVQVGTQADGIVRELHADFNSVVRRGQVLARLDPALIQAQIDQGRAAIAKATSDLEQLQVTKEEADRQLARVQALFEKQLVAESDVEDARVTAESAAADVKAAQDAIAQAQAQVDANLINLQHTVITSPIDGIVVARDVDVGQTVVSRMAAQTLFEIANDLHRMQVLATVDESDIGRVRIGQPVTFTVEAYPDRAYEGTVTQVRVNPNIDQNVVTYMTVVDVPNPDLTLRPGMTASIAIRVDGRSGVLKVPTGALRFKPDDRLFAAVHQPEPASARSTSVTVRPRGANTKQVWVLRNGTIVAVSVQVGLADESSTEVTAGLQPGDRVITNAIAHH